MVNCKNCTHCERITLGFTGTIQLACFKDGIKIISDDFSTWDSSLPSWCSFATDINSWYVDNFVEGKHDYVKKQNSRKAS